MVVASTPNARVADPLNGAICYSVPNTCIDLKYLIGGGDPTVTFAKTDAGHAIAHATNPMDDFVAVLKELAHLPTGQLHRVFS